MANLYVRSTDGSDADNGTTWALAKATLSGAAAIDAAGDTIYVSQAHAETPAATQTYSFAGTRSNPVKIICGNDGAEPPTAVSSAATSISGVGTYHHVFSGHIYCYGISFAAGTGSNNGQVQQGGGGELQVFESCQFKVPGTGSSAYIAMGFTVDPAHIIWKNCDAKFGGAGSGFANAGSVFEWNGGSVLSGSTALTNLFRTVSSPAGRMTIATLSGVDLSNMGAATNIALVVANRGLRITLRNCKLPTSWTGGLFSGTPSPAERIEMYNCDSGDTNYSLWIEDYNGTVKHETTLIKTGGASDGTTGLSWKMATTANVTYPTSPLESGEIAFWNDTTGSAKTLTVDILHDSATNLTDAEVWLDVQYLGTASSTLALFANDAKANALATAADQTASGATWTTTGMSNPNKQKLSVTLTPQKKGYYIAKVKLAKASKTIYVDPLIVVT